MRLQLRRDIGSLRSAAVSFIGLVDTSRWSQRLEQFFHDYEASPALGKIIGDYYWIELELHQFLTSKSPVNSLDTLAALLFAQTVTEVHSALSADGRRVLEGRLADALNSRTGFAPLYIEMDVARMIIDAEFEIEFTDMEGLGQYDLRFWNHDVEGEVECKSISVDAGRKIHRTDFYRFVDYLTPSLCRRAESNAKEVIVVSLNDRLPTDLKLQKDLRESCVRIVSDPSLSRYSGSFFSIEREPLLQRLENAPLNSMDEFHKCCKRAYGPASHIYGPLADDRACLIVVRSLQDDDTSAPQHEALKKAASQLTGTKPGFIAIQYEDIKPEDLLLPHLRHRAGILSYYLFINRQQPHICSTFFTCYGVCSSKSGMGTPAFAIPNPQARYRIAGETYPPFAAQVSDEEFARIVGGTLPDESISSIPIQG